MPDLFLALSIAGLVLTLNALRPVHLTVLQVPSFFASWLTSELAPQLLVLHVAGVAYFSLAGGLDETRGVVALGLCLLIAAGLAWMVARAHAVREVVEDSLKAGLGEGYDRSIIPPRGTYDLRVPWRQLVNPFRMRHPDVVRVRNVRYGEGRRNRLDVYHRRDLPNGAPVLLYVHGGGWVSVSNKDHQGKPMMLHFASRGWVCFSANYSLAPRATWPAHVIDLKRAIAWIRSHGASYGADPRFIVVAGGSAGGHLAALLALSPEEKSWQPGFENADTSVQACIPYYGIYDFVNEAGLWLSEMRTRFLVERIVMRASRAAAREEFLKASPLHRVHASPPPFFVVHGARDLLVPVREARLFVERLRAVSSRPVAYAELPGAQHAFDVFPSVRTAHVIRAAERFADWAYSDWVRSNAPSGEPATRL